MTNKLFDPRNTLELYGLKLYFNFFIKLISEDKLPKTILLTGQKGIGKFTFINHFLHHYYDKENYNEKNNTINANSHFHNKFKNNLFSNISYLDGENLNTIKIEDIRNLKLNLSKSPILNKKRFIILDSIENFNINSLNALLKIVEEPDIYTHFILINNKTKSLLETIRSRCLEIKIILNVDDKNEITESLLNFYNQEIILEKGCMHISPGNFLKFNYILNENKIDVNQNLSLNLKKIISLYKKEKDYCYKDLLFFLIDYHFYQVKNENNDNYEKLIKSRAHYIKSINEFFLYNLSQNTLINALENEIL